MKCNRCLFDDTIAHIDTDGTCEYCHLHDRLESASTSFTPVLNAIRKGKGKYNCLIGISGGMDSSTLLYMAVQVWSLRPLVIHFDNGYNTAEATHNMTSLITHLNVDAIIYKVNKKEYDTLNEAFIVGGLPDADIPNDIAMTKLMYETAQKYNIKYILNGHDFRTEGSTPRGWTYMDGKYLNSVYRTHTGADLVSYPLLTFMDQIRYGFKGIKQVRPFHFKSVHSSRDEYEMEMVDAINFHHYGAKHGENIYTEFVGAHLLPLKFGIDKRIVYLSAQVRSGSIHRNEAERILSLLPVFDTAKIPDSIWQKVGTYIGSRDDYEKYDFKKYKWLVYLLYKLKVVPQTFYVKYCQ